MKEFISIKNWNEEERPIEKLVQKGSNALTNTELLAILINTGTHNRSAIDIAKELLEKGANNLLELSKLSINDIKKIKGIGEKKAVTIISALELGKRRQLAQALERPKVVSAKQGYEIFLPFFVNEIVEQFYVLYLNNACLVMAIEKLSEGGITSTAVDIRIIFKKAFELNGVTKIMVAHNHPSGKIEPSDADKRFTQKLKQACMHLDIDLADHLIIGQNQYYSFANDGIL